MSQPLKQSTGVTVTVGPFLDKTDGVTPETSLTLSVKLSKNGGALAARNSATAITGGTDGYYFVPLSTTDTNTLGLMRLTVTDAANHLAVWEDFMVMPANVYDSLFGADVLQVDLIQVNGATTPVTNLENDYDATGYNKSASTIGTVTAVGDKTGYALTSAEHTSIADALLKRDMSAVTGESSRSPLNALRFLRNLWSISGSTLTVKKEDDSTTAWTATLTESAGANPVIGVDPG